MVMKLSKVSEKVIEDIFVTDKHILAEVLSLDYSDLNLLARQKTTDSGIMDLLYIHRSELLLIELKNVPFYKESVTQINRYYHDLLRLQESNSLIKAIISKIILVPFATSADHDYCEKHGVSLVVFNPELVLTRYYENFRGLTDFLNLKSGDYGVVRLGLLNYSLILLSRGNSIEKIADLEKLSEKTIRNRLSIAMLLDLAGKANGLYYLTELGVRFAGLSGGIDDRLSDKQKDLLREHINANPFNSSVAFSIFTVVESVFTLSKSSYPVSREALTDYFVKSAGKTTEWQTDKAKETATYIFSNYAIELELLSKVNNEFYLTPNGIKSVLLMQLHRSLKLIENKD
jgi:hypothetical protein